MKRRWSIRVSGLLLLILGSSLVTYAQRGRPGRAVFLGQAHVDGERDHDRISVDRYEGSFRGIQLEVRGGAIDFQRVVVHFENGDDQEVGIRYRIPAGGRTRVIDLAGDRRYIRSVELWYSKAYWRTRPKVKLWGIR
jgi:hypothetical protein